MFPFPKEWISASAQASMVSPMRSNVDGKVWTNNQEDHLNYRLDLATGKFENLGAAKSPAASRFRAYGMLDRSAEQPLSAGIRRPEHRPAR